jgi:hypothetical protein
MIRALTTAAVILLTGLVTGCKQERSLSEQPVVRNNELKKLERTDLNYHETPVLEVVSDMQTKFKCRIAPTGEAQKFISGNDLRITARVANLPKELAFKVVEAELEYSGLVLLPKNNVFGRPAYTLDRSIVREGTVPAATAKAPATGGSDY